MAGVEPAPVEQALVAYLTAELGVPVSTRVPDVRPDRFVTVTRVGGYRRNIGVSDPLLKVTCWAADQMVGSERILGEQLAWDLACEAYALFDGMPNSPDPLPLDVWVLDMYLSDPINLPDSATGVPRYQFTANLKTILEAS